MPGIVAVAGIVAEVVACTEAVAAVVAYTESGAGAVAVACIVAEAGTGLHSGRRRAVGDRR